MNSVALLVVWPYVEGVAHDQPPDLCRDVVSTVAQTFSYKIIGRQVLDRVVRTFDVVRYVSVVGKVHDEPRPRLLSLVHTEEVSASLDSLAL